MEEYPKPISKECMKKILYQMDNSIYKIKENKRIIGTCIFCYIKCPNKSFPVLISTYDIINEFFLANKNSINIFTSQKWYEKYRIWNY